MNADNTVYSVDALRDLSEDQLYQRLFKSWGITSGKIEVWGELKLNQEKSWAGLYDIKTVSNNREVTYPVDGANNTTAFMSPKDAEELKGSETQVFIKCELELTSEVQRVKHNNPLELRVCRIPQDHKLSL